MKIGIYLNYSSPGIGGGYIFEQQLLEQLIAVQSMTKHEFVVLFRGKYDSSGRIDVIDLNEGSGKNPGLVRKIRNYCIKRQYNITSNEELERARVEKILRENRIQFLIYLKQGDLLTFDIPYLTVVWDIQHRIQPFFPEVSYNRAWQKREFTLHILLQRATFVVTGTKAGKRQLEKYYQIDPERIIVNPMPLPQLDTEVDKDEVRNVLERHHLSGNYLLYPAQFWPHKNHMALLRTIRLLKDKYNLEFDLVCTGSDMGNRSYIENSAARLGIGDNFRYLGFVDRKELSVLYKKAFALSFVSFFGPDNIPPLEAFISGCPVIASAVDGADEQMGEAALLVNPSDADNIADAVYYLYRDPEVRQSLINRGYEQIKYLYRGNYLDNILNALDNFETVRECWNDQDTYYRTPMI
ncbi:MAG TPA: glycosyltransferase family 1 protein [Gammaproteobacteria bacterium]|nr:glycosyltransferase family 1 protein [Gammaproteobacteria bacterium]